MEARTEIPPSEGRRDTGGGDAAHSLPVEPSGASGSGSTVQPKPAGLSGWLTELKRRRVVRTLVGYGIASFAVLQIVEPVMHGLHWPETVLSYVVVALAAGFPIVITLAWVFDVRGGRIERTGPAAKATGLRGIPLALLLVGIGVLAAAPGLIWYFFIRGGARTEAVPVPATEVVTSSIAVLPFVDLSQAKDQEYFADGLAEELLNLLGKVPGLQVAARTSAFSFKSKNIKISEIGRELGVATVLEGSVRKSGDRLRITTQLISAADGYHLWSETYDRKLTDLFAVQEEIAQAVVSVLKVKLLPGHSPKAQEHRTESTDAYLHYLVGRKLSAFRTLDNNRRAFAAFQKALDLDPGFAPAWAGLGYMRSWLADYGPSLVERVEQKTQALNEVDKSIALAPGLAEAYVIRGILRIRDRFDWTGSQADFEGALAINPDDPFALEQYGFWFLAWRGQLREAAASLRKALERDRLNPALWHRLGCVLVFDNQLEAARKAFDREYEIASTFSNDDGWPVYLLILEGKPADALRVSSGLELEAWRLVGAALAHRVLGHEEESQKALAALRAPHLAPGFSVQVAQVHAFRGERNAAFEWLDRAYENRDAGMMRLKVDPLLRKLRDDPRYTALLRKMNLPLD